MPTIPNGFRMYPQLKEKTGCLKSAMLVSALFAIWNKTGRDDIPLRDKDLKEHLYLTRKEIYNIKLAITKNPPGIVSFYRKGLYAITHYVIDGPAIAETLQNIERSTTWQKS